MRELIKSPNRLFAIGDIHGCFDSLKELIENNIRLTQFDRLVFLGDYIDRGDKSKEVVDYIIDLQEKKYDLILLKGNHEAMLLDAFVNPKQTSKWIQNGGDTTLKSFEISSIKEIKPKHIKFFKELNTYYLYENLLYVHAGFNDEIVDPFSDSYSMLWKCKEKYSNPLLSDKIIVHGHQPISVSKCIERIHSNQCVINIDTGCVFKNKEGIGKLTAYDAIHQKIYVV